MASAKDVRLRVIPAKVANPFIRGHHYSGKVVNNSRLHFGAFLNGHLHGVMSYGPSMDKRKLIGLVEGTPWNGFLELNRMAFDPVLPRNSESRCIAVSLRMIRERAPQVKWVVSFADGCSCGDGAIYRASGFLLTGIKENANIAVMPDGTKLHKMTLESQPTKPIAALGGRSYLDITGGGSLMGALPRRRGRAYRAGVPAPLRPLPRPRMARPPHRPGHTVRAHRRAGSGHVPGRARHGCVEANGCAIIGAR